MVKEMIKETNIQPTSNHPLVIADRKKRNMIIGSFLN